MNYLAHAYLSFRDPEILIGNMVSDFVKGRKKFSYPPRVQEGINLHRAIDAYTDEHPATKSIKQLFRPAYRLYSGAFADIIYDHFLANDRTIFKGEDLYLFSQWVYESLERHTDHFPLHFSRMFHFMKRENWLLNYRERWGIEKSFGGLVHRATYLYESDTAFELFNLHYDTLRDSYQVFFPDLVAHVSGFIDQADPIST